MTGRRLRDRRAYIQEERSLNNLSDTGREETGDDFEAGQRASMEADTDPK